MGRGVEDFRAQQCPGQQGAEQRYRQADADRHRAPGADDVFQHTCQRRVLQLCELRLAHDAQRQHIHQHQQRQHAQKADHRGATHVRALLGPRRIDTGALDTDKHKHGDQHHVAHLVHHIAHIRVAHAPDITGEDLGLEGHAGNHDKHQQRHDLGHGGDLIDKRGLLDPTQHQEMHGPQQQGRAADGHRRVALTEYRKKITEGAEQQHEVTHVAQPGTDPVTPGGRETHVVAKTGLGVGVHPTVEVGLAVGEGLEHEREGQHAHGRNDPTDQYGADVSAGGHILRQRENPAANH
ncbi:hypothetical protein PS708_06031 [Pseudomonas fluorescens]|nr:hypothetical protein PS708_06031 [Pseudomonas fluorescens]